MKKISSSDEDINDSLKNEIEDCFFLDYIEKNIKREQEFISTIIMKLDSIIFLKKHTIIIVCFWDLSSIKYNF